MVNDLEIQAERLRRLRDAAEDHQLFCEQMAHELREKGIAQREGCLELRRLTEGFHALQRSLREKLSPTLGRSLAALDGLRLCHREVEAHNGNENLGRGSAHLEDFVAGWGAAAQVLQGAVEDTSKLLADQAILEMLSNSPAQPPITATTEQTAPKKEFSDKAADNFARVEAFKNSVFDKTGRKISKINFWTVAGYSDPTEFNRWQRSDSKCTGAAQEAFKRVLAMAPQEFIDVLDKKLPPKA